MKETLGSRCPSERLLGGGFSHSESRMVRGQWRSDPEDQLLAQFADTVLPLWIVLRTSPPTAGMPALGLSVGGFLARTAIRK
jgi:hypothetical protein